MTNHLGEAIEKLREILTLFRLNDEIRDHEIFLYGKDIVMGWDFYNKDILYYTLGKRF